MEAFFSWLKTELADRFESCVDAKMQLCDYIEVFYNQRRHSTLKCVSPAAFECQSLLTRVASATAGDIVRGGILQSSTNDDRQSWASCEVALSPID